jgi:O-succinylbenzoic acid--CoA ligase
LIRAGKTVCPISTRLPVDVARIQAQRIGAVELVDPRFENRKGEGRLEIQEEQPATIVFTSGSTGEARAALHTFENHYYSAAGSNRNIPLAPGDRWLLSLPLYHVGGLAILFRCVLGRATVILPKRGLSIEETIAASDATHVSMVPTQLRRILPSPSESRSLKAVLLGGSAIPPDLIRRAHAEGLPIHTSYGLTEMASQVTTTAPGASFAELETSGAVLPFREIRISGEGEILVRGRTRFAGYVEREALVAPFDNEGWFGTKDLGAMDANGRLRVRGRMDNMFISGGENVIPEEIEAVLTTFPAVLRALVVPVPDDEFGERPVAFVERVAGVPEARLREFLSDLLPRFKIPLRFFPWPEGTDEPGLKLDRSKFRRKADELMSA